MALNYRGVQLSGEKLMAKNLRSACFIECDARGTDFSGSDLSGANFTRARCQKALFSGCALDTAQFGSSVLAGATFVKSELYDTNFHGADLNNCNFTRVFAKDSHFRGANLSRSQINHSLFIRSWFDGASFAGAHISHSALHHCEFAMTDFTDGSLWGVSFVEANLSSVKGLASLRNVREVALDPRTLFSSGRFLPRSFLLGSGVPPLLVEYLPSLVADPIEFDSCFISYSTKDGACARTLRIELLEKGINAWLFEEDADWGRPVWTEIDNSIRMHDRVIVICSEQSLQSFPVLREIERALQREDSERRDVLFPVRIDDYIFEKWQHPRKADVVSKVIGDFRSWEDPQTIQRGILRLLASLRRKAT